jgi:hypothetical protein
MQESKQLWAICTKFKVLPNDPLVKGLTTFQRLWIIANMNAEYESQEKLMQGNQKKASVSSDGTDPAALDMLIGLAKKHGRSDS